MDDEYAGDIEHAADGVWADDVWADVFRKVWGEKARPVIWSMLALSAATAIGWVLAFIGAFHAGWIAATTLGVMAAAAMTVNGLFLNAWHRHRLVHQRQIRSVSSCALCAQRTAATKAGARLPSSRRWWTSWATFGFAKALAASCAMMWWWPMPVAASLGALLWCAPLIVYSVAGHRFDDNSLELLQDFLDGTRPAEGLPTPEL